MARAPNVAPAGGPAFACSDVDVFADVDGAALGKESGSSPAATIDGLNILVCKPVNARVRGMSSALLATSISLYRWSAMLSWGTMNRVPM